MATDLKFITPSGSLTLEAEDTAGASTVVIPKAGIVSPDDLKEIGVGQVWTQFAVGVNRIAGTTYTNTSGRPIEIAVGVSNYTHYVTAVINGVTLSSYAGGLQAIVPNGHTYVLTATTTISQWQELR